MKISGTLFQKSARMSEEMLSPPETACPFCFDHHRESVFSLQENPDIYLLKCKTCCAVSASRFPTDSVLKSYYSNYYASSGNSTVNRKVTIGNARRFGTHLAKKFLHHHHRSNVSIMDFGGGDGTISCIVAEHLLKNGVKHVDITVVDYNENLIQPGDERISLKHALSPDQVTDQYSFIIASAIIEHLREPGKTLNHLLKRLDHNGVFYARTPWLIPIAKAFSPLGIEWDFTYPAHLHDLGRDFWEKYFTAIATDNPCTILLSKPSITETCFKHHFARALSAHLMKSPWYLFGARYNLVGGWEIFVQKSAGEPAVDNRRPHD